MEIAKSILFFILAGICELGGAYLIWLWIKSGRSFVYGLAGAAILVTYGIMHTLQSSNYCRIQAAYSGFLIVLALVWGWQVDKDHSRPLRSIGRGRRTRRCALWSS